MLISRDTKRMYARESKCGKSVAQNTTQNNFKQFH